MTILPLFVTQAVAAATGIADLTQIPRTIGAQPAYQSPSPRYCLVVIGLEAKTRVWLVHDGDHLYVDRNGDGDLIDADEKVAATKGPHVPEGLLFFDAGEIRGGGSVHKALQVEVRHRTSPPSVGNRGKEASAYEPASTYRMSLEVAMPGWQGNGLDGRVRHQVSQSDIQGEFQFGTSPQEAPIVHFAGPLEITLFGRHTLTIGRQSEIYLAVGTRGLGPGTISYMDYAGAIPDSVYPVLDFAFPAKRPGEPPIHRRYELKQRC